MKILHLCLSNWFVDQVGYQENELVRQHVADGHEVLVIASTETHSDAGKLVYVEPSDYMGAEGARIIRLPYRKFLPERVMRKLRIHKGLKGLLTIFKPDVILFHGTCGWELLTTSSYVRENPSSSLYVDSHEDQFNSGRNWISKELLHKIYYANILRFTISKVKKILCYSLDSIEFVHNVYKIPHEKLELFPLGGRPVIHQEYHQRRTETRKEYGLQDDVILFLQSGKQTRRKKVLESISAFSNFKDKNWILFIVGNIEDSIKNEFETAVDGNKKIRFLGWKNLDDLTSLLCAADIYLQPGTQSVTMQHSLCCHCAVILDDVLSHRFYVSENGWLIGRDGSLQQIIEKSLVADLEKMQLESYKFAYANLNYEMLAQRILTNDTH